MSNIFTKFSRNYRGLEYIKEKLTFSLKENDKLLEELLTKRAQVLSRAAEEGNRASDFSQARQNDKSTPLVSVIVPVMNTARYLHKCLDHLLAQTLKNIEIICVDDGSTDDSLAILNEYAAKDQRIIVVSQDHLGVSAARNAALERAQAPYLMSCDSDDWFDQNMCKVMVEAIERENVEVVICRMKVTFDVPEELQQNVTEYLRLKFFGKQKITAEIMLNTDVSLCNKIFKRSIVEENNIDFPVGLLFEDAYFNDAYLVVAENIYYLHLPLYNYLRHDTSIMSTSYKKTGTAADYLQIAFRTWDYLETHDCLNEFSDYFWQRFIQYTSFALDHLEGAEKEEAKSLAQSFAEKQKESLDRASSRTRACVKSLLYSSRKPLNAASQLVKLLYAKLSLSRELRHEVIELTTQNIDKQAQIQALLEEDLT